MKKLPVFSKSAKTKKKTAATPKKKQQKKTASNACAECPVEIFSVELTPKRDEDQNIKEIGKAIFNASTCLIEDDDFSVGDRNDYKTEWIKGDVRVVTWIVYSGSAYPEIKVFVISEKVPVFSAVVLPDIDGFETYLESIIDKAKDVADAEFERIEKTKIKFKDIDDWAKHALKESLYLIKKIDPAEFVHGFFPISKFREILPVVEGADSGFDIKESEHADALVDLIDDIIDDEQSGGKMLRKLCGKDYEIGDVNFLRNFVLPLVSEKLEWSEWGL